MATQIKVLYSTILAVTMVHVVAIFLLFLQFYPTPSLIKPMKKERVVVKTVRLKPVEKSLPAPKQMSTKPIKKEIPKIEPVKKTVVTPKKEPVSKPKPVPKKTTKPAEKKITPAVSKKNDLPVNNKRKELIAKAQESIAKITLADANIVTHSPNLTVPELKANMAESAHEDAGYQEELAERLRMLLRLPIDGQVKIKLTLNRQGKFITLAILDSDNKLNSEYVEKEVPKISFPPFSRQFKDYEQYTFPITLKS